MDWCDVEDILLNGTKQQITSLRCPDCGGQLHYSYSGGEYLSITCQKCRTIVREYKPPYGANCEKYFGTEYTTGELND